MFHPKKRSRVTWGGVEVCGKLGGAEDSGNKEQGTERREAQRLQLQHSQGTASKSL